MKDSHNSHQEITQDFYPFLKVYQNGAVEKYNYSFEKISANNDPLTGVQSKDVIISTKPFISARIFIPQTKILDWKLQLPLIFYIHGGGFCLGSAFEKRYHDFVSSLVAKANAIAVSINYRLAPEDPIPACYDDSWVALQWVVSGSDSWLKNHVNLNRVFLMGDSSGGNIAHNLLIRANASGLHKVIKVVGLALMHPYFGGSHIDGLWLYLCPKNNGLHDRRIRPLVEDLSRINCERVIVILAERDYLKDPGKRYCEDLNKSGWTGNLEIVEHKGVRHVFHLGKPDCEQALDLMRRLVSFIKQDKVKMRSKF